ncbi:MAG: hypothetical protein N2167_01370 [Flavobacteriales bacterium]|nr:hypothetical protein [Flavobacteriales bacterium]
MKSLLNIRGDSSLWDTNNFFLIGLSTDIHKKLLHKGSVKTNTINITTYRSRRANK